MAEALLLQLVDRADAVPATATILRTLLRVLEGLARLAFAIAAYRALPAILGAGVTILASQAFPVAANLLGHIRIGIEFQPHIGNHFRPYLLHQVGYLRKNLASDLWHDLRRNHLGSTEVRHGIGHRRDIRRCRKVRSDAFRRRTRKNQKTCRQYEEFHALSSLIVMH